MTDPLGAGLVGFAKSNKSIEFGWSRDEGEQFFERLTQNLRQIDEAVHHQWANNPRQNFELKYAFFGGVIDAGASWVIIDDGDITLPNGATSFVERGTGGTVSSNTTAFSHPDAIPMAEVRTRDGEIIDVFDCRPELGAPSGSVGTTITFPEIVGVILDGQVPLSAVKQWEALLAIDFTQLTGVATRAQLPSEIAYEDEANTFSEVQTIPELEAPNIEALLRFIGNSDR